VIRVLTLLTPYSLYDNRSSMNTPPPSGNTSPTMASPSLPLGHDQQNISTATAAETADPGIVAGLNNAGVSFLALQREDLASELFRDALQFSTGRLGLTQATQIFHKASAWHHEEIKRKQQEGRVEGPGDTSSSEEQDHSSSDALSQTSLPFVHAEGIPLMPSATAYSEDVLLSTTITSSIIIFNLAVVCHLQALRGESVDLQRLTRARNLYHKSALLLRDARVFTDASKGGVNPILDLLVLALCNNLAQISHQLGNYTETRLYFGRMMQYATTVDRSAHYADDALAALTVHHHKSSFLLNAMILHAPTLAAAA